MVATISSAAAEAAVRSELSAGPSEALWPRRMGANKRAQERQPLAYRRRRNRSNLKGHVAVAQGPVVTRSSHRALTRSAASNSTRQIRSPVAERRQRQRVSEGPAVSFDGL